MRRYVQAMLSRLWRARAVRPTGGKVRVRRRVFGARLRQTKEALPERLHGAGRVQRRDWPVRVRHDVARERLFKANHAVPCGVQRPWALHAVCRQVPLLCRLGRPHVRKPQDATETPPCCGNAATGAAGGARRADGAGRARWRVQVRPKRRRANRHGGPFARHPRRSGRPRRPRRCRWPVRSWRQVRPWGARRARRAVRPQWRRRAGRKRWTACGSVAVPSRSPGLPEQAPADYQLHCTMRRQPGSPRCTLRRTGWAGRCRRTRYGIRHESYQHYMSLNKKDGAVEALEACSQ